MIHESTKLMFSSQEVEYLAFGLLAFSLLFGLQGSVVFNSTNLHEVPSLCVLSE